LVDGNDRLLDDMVNNHNSVNLVTLRQHNVHAATIPCEH
jgi:hypothetical protein